MVKINYLKLLENYMAFCGLKESTKKQYRLMAERYLYFTDNSPEWSRQEIMQFITSFSSDSNTYKSWVLHLVKIFHKSIQDSLPDNKKNWPLGPREGPKVEVKPQPTYSEEQVKKLFRIIKSIRDYAIVRLLFVTGMRREELCNLKRDDYSEGNIMIKMVKGEETRTVRLDKETCKAIDRYLDSRKDNDETLFVSEHGRPFISTELSHIFSKYFKKVSAGKRTGFHAFRRGVVTMLHDKGLSETEIQKWGGWKTGEMVRRYIQIRPARITDKVASVHPFYQED